jgi:hypothetical protein
MEHLENRQHIRSNCFTYCLLMGRGGDTYEGLLGNISKGGAMVKVSADNLLHIGDSCDIMFTDKSNAFPLKRQVKIVRFDSDKMGVKFLS